MAITDINRPATHDFLSEVRHDNIRQLTSMMISISASPANVVSTTNDTGRLAKTPLGLTPSP
jgi:hypothetical protein